MRRIKPLLMLGAAGLAALAVQAQWTGMDLGGPALAGSHTGSPPGPITIVGGGTDIWGTADQCHFYYKSFTGPFDVKVRVEDLQGPDTWSKAELMMRVPDGSGTPQAGDPFIGNMATRAGGENGVEAQWRATRGGGANWVGAWPDPRINPGYPDCYLRLQRAGQIFNCYYSNDGSSWNLYRAVDATTLGMGTIPSTVYVGLAVTAHNDADLTGGVAVFSELVELFDPTMTVTGSGGGLVASVFDSTTVAVTAINQVLLDGEDVTGPATDSKAGGVTTVRYRRFPDKGDFLAVGSTHDVEVTAAAGGSTYVLAGSFTVGPYTTVGPEYQIASATGSGLHLDVLQTVEVPPYQNSTATAEMLVADALGLANVAATWPGELGPDGTGIATINFDANPEEFGTDIDDTPADGPDEFNTVRPTASPVPNGILPGIPGDSGTPYDNYVVELYGVAQIPAGFHTLRMRSDDGFKFTVAPGAPGPGGLNIGEFDGGRGAGTPTDFSIAVPEAGFYPVRILQWQGGGGANAELVEISQTTGALSLVNGTGSTIKLFMEPGEERAHLTKLVPADGYPSERKPTISVGLTDGTATQVKAGATKLIVDGVEVATGTKTLTWTAATDYDWDQTIPCQVLWTEVGSPEQEWTENFDLVIRPMSLDDFPEGTISIDAEMFDYDGGQYIAGLEFGYDGSEYNGLNAVFNVDYSDASGGGNTPDSNLYRTTGTNVDTNPNTPMDVNQGGFLDQERAGFTVTTNHKLGWTGNGEWCNYTRNIPAAGVSGSTGFWTFWSLCSHGDANASIGGQVGLVTAGVGTTSQTVVQLAASDGPAIGGWGTNSLQPSRNADGSPSVFKLDGGVQTLRYTKRNGDFDAFFLVPMPEPPASLDAAPNHISVRRDAVTLVWTIKKGGTELDPASVALTIDGTPVAAAAARAVRGSPVISVTDDVTVHTITADLTGTLWDRGAHTYALDWADNGTPATPHTWEGTFNVNPYPTEGIFAIEAEDFNHDGGQTVAAASVMPYYGGAYEGLDATLGVDYGTNHGNDSQAYREPLRPGPEPYTSTRNVQIAAETGARYAVDRGVWEVTANYKIGWGGNAANWQNYTRTIPDNDYEIWVAQSHDTMGGTDILRGTVSLVASDPTQPDQVLNEIGTWSWPGSGGWSQNDIFPILNPDGTRKVVSLGGTQTLRWTDGNGDRDYLLLVPTGAGPTEITIDSIVLAEGQAVITWSGGETLQGADAVTGPWTDIAGATSPYSVAPTGSYKFYRLRQ